MGMGRKLVALGRSEEEFMMWRKRKMVWFEIEEGSFDGRTIIESSWF